MKKDVFTRIGGFNPEFRNSQDLEYWLRCAMIADFVVMPDVLLYKKNHSGNLSANAVRQRGYHRQILVDLLANRGDYLRKNGCEGLAKLMLARVHYDIGSLHFEKGEVRQAFGAFREGLSACPSPRNLARYLWAVSKKLVRLATRDALNRRNLVGLRHRMRLAKHG